MANFPKPVDTRPPLALPSKAAVISQFAERERVLQERHLASLEFAKQLQQGQDELQARQQQLDLRTAALGEGELLLTNSQLLHQKALAQLLDQNQLLELRVKLDRQREDDRKREAFLRQYETRLHEQYSTREEDLSKREAWVSAEHETATRQNTRRLQAIVFTDVVSFSALMQVNEALTIQKVRADLLRLQVEGKAHGGLLVNTMGDGMLMVFPSAIQAVRFSMRMQKSFNANVDEGALRHRFGLHIADVALLSGGGIAGDGVNIASRLESQAPQGGICMSAVVHAMVKGKLPLPPSLAEEISLKNIVEPMVVYQFTSQTIAAAVDLDETSVDLAPTG